MGVRHQQRSAGWSAAAAGVRGTAGMPVTGTCGASLPRPEERLLPRSARLPSGSAFGLCKLSALDAHPAAEAFGVAVVAAAFFGGVEGQSEPLAWLHS